MTKKNKAICKYAEELVIYRILTAVVSKLVEDGIKEKCKNCKFKHKEKKT